MKTNLLLLCFFFAGALDTINAQSLQEQLLGKWKQTKDEGYEFFINTPEAQNGPKEEMDKFYDLMKKYQDQSFKNFYSKDSMTSTIVDRTEIIQEKSVWNIREAGSVITWNIRFAPKVLQAKIVKITDQELILIYLNGDRTLGRFKTYYTKVDKER
jgi:hypothetical protein